MQKKYKKLLFATLIFLTLGFFFLYLREYLSLDAIKASYSVLEDFYKQHVLLTIIIYALIGIVGIGCFLPISNILVVVCGALFGLFPAIIISSIVNTIGAVVAFQIARSTLNEYVKNNHRNSFITISDRFNQHGITYLFIIRMIPLFPFFLVNMIMGILSINLIDFIIGTLLGSLPLTTIYAYAGTKLASINTLSDVFSSEIIMMLFIIILIPMIIKKYL